MKKSAISILFPFQVIILQKQVQIRFPNWHLHLVNGFTFVEYYLSRGMNIDDFAPNLSFLFHNGIDPEYSVIGRVARRIWAKAIKINIMEMIVRRN